MSEFTCPWCGKESEYEMVVDTNGRYWEPGPTSPILSKDYEKISCRCPACRGTFDAIPQLRRCSVNVFEPFVWKDSRGVESVDYDLVSYGIDELRREYMVQEGYVEERKFSLPKGFSLPPSQDRFALPPAQSKFSLSNLRRRRR